MYSDYSFVHVLTTFDYEAVLTLRIHYICVAASSKAAAEEEEENRRIISEIVTAHKESVTRIIIRRSIRNFLRTIS